MTFFNFKPSIVNSLECISMKNQEVIDLRVELINLNTNNPVFYIFSK